LYRTSMGLRLWPLDRHDFMSSKILPHICVNRFFLAILPPCNKPCGKKPSLLRRFAILDLKHFFSLFFYISFCFFVHTFVAHVLHSTPSRGEAHARTHVRTHARSIARTRTHTQMPNTVLDATAPKVTSRRACTDFDGKDLSLDDDLLLFFQKQKKEGRQHLRYDEPSEDCGD
jgi:hypothetical protein